jgi:hypothetical protein
MTGVMSARMHDDRKGHHYYTTSAARISCIVVMALAALIPTNRCKGIERKALWGLPAKNEPSVEAGLSS